MKDTDYAFAVARIRSNEKKLLTSSELDGIIGAASYDDALSLLNAKGYNIKGTDYASALNERTAEFWKLINEVLPDKSRFDSIILKNDFANLKILTKAFFLEKEFGELYEYPSVYSPEYIKECVLSGKNSLLPECMQHAHRSSYRILSKTRFAQLSDCVIDRACMEWTLKTAKKASDPILLRLAQVDAACTDIKVLYRCICSGKSREFMQRAVAECDAFDKKDIISAACGGLDAFLEFLLHTDYKNSVEALKTGTAEFEKWCDNRLLSLLSETKTEVFGISPIVAFYFAGLTEVKNVRIVLSAKLNGFSADTVRARVRDSFV